MSKQGLTQQQQQQLRQRLSPKQVRFGRMLEMSAPEFEEEVHRVLDENPALEAVDAERPEPTDFAETAEQLQRADYATPDDVPTYRLNLPAGGAPVTAHEQADTDAAGELSLTEQLADFDLSPHQREVTNYVIGALDSNGYLTRSAEAIADDMAMSAGLYVEPSEVKEAIEIVRELEPAGIGAENLRDCLLLQLERMQPRGAVELATRIVRDHFDAFAKRHFDRLRTSLGVSDAEFDAAVRVIASLNPKPGAMLDAPADPSMRISPDLIIEQMTDGSFSISLAGNIPELEIAESFRPDAEESLHRSVDAKAFIKSRREEASDFIELARMRGATLMAVAKAIVKLQPEYFEDFDRARLRPMVLRDIGKLTGLDLSVISRATSSKYMMTPHGTVLLKSLFSEGVGDDSDTSSHAIDEALRSLIAAEDKSAPLSDAALCEALKARGLDVARRTVTKYRERLKLPVARLRRNS